MNRQKNKKARGLKIFLIVIFLSAQNLSIAQPLRNSNPKKVTIASALLPGLGQVLNKKAWKTVVVYSGLGGFAYSFAYNKKQMNSYQQALSYRLDDDPNTIDYKYSELSNNAVLAQRDRYRRYKDIASLGFVGFYLLQIVDANVDAHLNEFKVNKDLSLNLNILPVQRNTNRRINFELVFHF